MDQFSVLNVIFNYLDPIDCFRLLLVNSTWNSIGQCYLRKLHPWLKTDLLMQQFSTLKQTKPTTQTPRIFCTQRGAHFILYYDKNFLRVMSVNGYYFDFYFDINVGSINFVKYAIVPLTNGKRLLLLNIFTSTDCKFVIDSTDLFRPKAHYFDTKINMDTVDCSSWFYFHTNQTPSFITNFNNFPLSSLNLDFGVNVIPYSEFALRKSALVSWFFIKDNITNRHHLFGINDDTVLRYDLIFNFITCGGIIVNDLYYVVLCDLGQVRICNLVTNEIFNVETSDTIRNFYPLIENKFIYFTCPPTHNNVIKYYVYDITLRNITHIGSFDWFQYERDLYFDKTSNELCFSFLSPCPKMKKLKIM